MKKLLLILGLLCNGAPIIAVATQSPPDLSAEDLKMLEEIGKEVERYVSSLPTEAQLRAQGVPEEEIKKRETKEKFDAEVKRYSEMSEKQLLEEMEKVFAEAANQIPQQPQPEIERPTYTPPTTPQETKVEQQPKTIAPSDKQMAALKLIDAVLVSLNNFLNKAQVMVELPGKIPSWIKEGKLKNWPPQLSWNTFIGQVEELQAKLNKLKDRDPRSGTFKYLDDFIKDESLNNNLAKVRDSLQRNEPKIELSSFSIDKISTESRTAIRSVLLILQEATSILSIPQALDKIFEEYEPTAKKIKESEEAAQKRALEESRRGRYPGGVTASAPAPRERIETYGKGRETDRYTLPSLEAPSRSSDKSSEPLKPGAQAGGAAAGAGGDKKAQPDKKDEAGKKEEDKENVRASKKAESYETEFMAGLEIFSEAINESAALKDIEKHVKDQNFADDDVAKGILRAREGIVQATKAARKLKAQFGRLNDSGKKEFKKAVKDDYKIVKSEIDTLSNQINKLAKPSDVFISMPVTPSANRADHTIAMKSKYYAYFGKMFADDLRKYVDAAKKTGLPLPALAQKVEELYTKNPHIANLNDLQAKIKELKKAVDEFN